LAALSPRMFESRFGLAMGNREPSLIEPVSSREDRIAREWFRHCDLTFLAGQPCGTPPIWIYDLFRWGPHRWPVAWVDLLAMPSHDCGAMAALSTEIYQMRGVDARPIQLVLSFNDSATVGWSALWRDTVLDYDWCGRGFAYHEATAVFDRRGRFKIWDPLGRFWLPLGGGEGYERIAAYRVEGVGRSNSFAGKPPWIDTASDKQRSAA